MTDYELMSVFGEFVALQQDAYMNFVTIIFAYIVAGYFVAEKLSSKMTTVITILFTIVAFQEASVDFFVGQD